MANEPASCGSAPAPAPPQDPAGAVPPVVDVPSSLARAFHSLDERSKRVLGNAEDTVLLFSLQGAVASLDFLASRISLTAAVIQTAQERGKAEEARALDVAGRELGLHIMNTSATPNAMDAHVPYNALLNRGRIGLEIKSYSKTVPTDEVEKFKRDLAHGAYAAGVFISVRSAISKIPKGVHVNKEFTLASGPVWVVYSTPVSEATDVIRAGVAVAKLLCELPGNGLQCWLPGTSAEKLAGAIHEEIAYAADGRKRLREADEGTRRIFSRISDSMLLSQRRLAEMALDLDHADASDVVRAVEEVTDDPCILSVCSVLFSCTGRAPRLLRGSAAYFKGAAETGTAAVERGEVAASVETDEGTSVTGEQREDDGLGARAAAAASTEADETLLENSNHDRLLFGEISVVLVLSRRHVPPEVKHKADGSTPPPCLVAWHVLVPVDAAREEGGRSAESATVTDDEGRACHLIHGGPRAARRCYELLGKSRP
jgi:hypothetical protein